MSDSPPASRPPRAKMASEELTSANPAIKAPLVGSAGLNIADGSDAPLTRIPPSPVSLDVPELEIVALPPMIVPPATVMA